MRIPISIDKRSAPASRRRVTVMIFMILAGAVLWSGCRTTKTREELSSIGRLYQNMTAHYNGYFNATEIMKESVVKLEEGHQDNYHQLLPVYEYNAVYDAGSVAGELDRAIKKSSVVISLHRPSKWTDDSYLLIGQAQYLKQDYESAQKTLEYATRNFDEKGNSKEKVKKKQQLTKRERQAKRLADIKAKRKEVEEKRKRMAKERKERNKELEEQRKERAKERKEDKKERENAAKDKRKQREQDAKDRSKARKEDQRAREKDRKAAAKARSKNKPITVREQRELEEKRAAEAAEKSAKEKAKQERLAAKGASKKDNPDAPSKTKENKTQRKTAEDLDKELAEQQKQEEEAEDVFGEEEDDNKKNKKKKKKEDKIKDGFLAHVPSHNEALLWLARTYVERDFISQAERTFGKIERQESVHASVWREFYPARADYYIKTEQYDLAIPALEEAIERANVRQYKARYAYIIAQLHAMNGAHDQSATYFQRAGKLSTQFEMEFSAKLNERLQGFRKQNTPIDKMDRQLLRMANEEKNAKYQDQVYFQLAMLHLEAGNKTKATEYLSEALKHAQSNPVQKIEIHYTLAELYYEQDEFGQAYDHYGKSLAAMNKGDRRFYPTERKADAIQKIARLQEQVDLQDSLIALAALPEDELRKIAADILAQRKEEAKEAGRIAQRQARGAFNGSLGGSIQPVASTSTKASNFFAYDDKARRKGERDFKRLWGQRALVDDWRRQSEVDIRASIAEEQEEINESAEATEQEVDRIFADLPKTPEALAKAKASISDALFDLGMEYRNKIERLDLSTNSFERFVADADSEDDRVPQAYYFMYLNARDQSDLTTAKHYADLLQAKYPSTKYAMLAKDPSYLKAILAKEGDAEGEYKRVYAAFEAGDYKSVYDAFDVAHAKYGAQHPLLAKYALLKAMTVGNLKGRSEYTEALRQVVAQYPNTPEQIKAREIIRFLNGDDSALSGGSNGPVISETSFKVEPDNLHYIIVVVHNKEVNSMQDVRISISDYNKVFHSLERYTMRAFTVNREKETEAILLRKFDSQKDAMKYYEEVNKRKGEFLPEGTDADIYAISKYNYREVIKAGHIDGYKFFFQTEYLN